MQRAGGNGALIMMHAENGIAIDVLVAAALDKGQTDADVHGLTRPSDAGGRGDPPRDLPRAGGRRPAVHRAPVVRAGARGRSRARDRGQNIFAETCPQYLFLSRGGLARAGLRGRQVRVHAAAAAAPAMQSDLWRGLRTDDLKSSPPTTARSA